MALGIEGLKKIVLLGAAGVNVGEKIANHGGILSALSLIGEVQALGSLQKGQLLAEAKDLSKEERSELNQVFKAKLVLDNKVLESKIEAGADVVDEAIDCGLEALAVYEHGKALSDKVKALLA